MSALPEHNLLLWQWVRQCCRLKMMPMQTWWMLLRSHVTLFMSVYLTPLCGSFPLYIGGICNKKCLAEKLPSEPYLRSRIIRIWYKRFGNMVAGSKLTHLWKLRCFIYPRSLGSVAALLEEFALTGIKLWRVSIHCNRWCHRMLTSCAEGNICSSSNHDFLYYCPYLSYSCPKCACFLCTVTKHKDVEATCATICILGERDWSFISVPVENRWTVHLPVEQYSRSSVNPTPL